ncbi:MAG: dephospho-CoA kinase [Planctomycetota bacterium]
MNGGAGPVKPVIGLLGGPGSGKSFVAAAMADHGAAVIDADALARAALDRDGVRDVLAGWWGPGVIGGDGRVDRAAVAARVFENPAELARLESLVHPIVNRQREALRERHRIDPAVRAIVEDCPLLLERGLERDCNVLVFVDTPAERRQRRVAESRGWSAEDLARREKNQLPLDTKRGRADYVLDGGGEPPDVQVHTRRLLDRIVSNRTLSHNV